MNVPRIIISPLGSAGDVHPFLGLAVKLQERGYRVTFVVSEYFRELTERLGLEYVELGTTDDFLRLSNHPDLWHPRRAFPYIFRHGIAPTMRAQYELLADRYVPGQTILVASCLGFGARLAAEKLGIPLVSVHCQPSVIWSKFDSPVLPGMTAWPNFVPSWGRSWIFRLGEWLVIDRISKPETDRFRRELGLPPLNRLTDWWHSPEMVVGLFPDWFAAPQPDWPRQITLTHFPLWDERGLTAVPVELEQFLAAGDPPIAFTPGSAMQFGQEFFSAAAEACRILGRRGMLLSRFTDHIPESLPEQVRHFTYAPFSQILPRCAAIVHHGGIGTTAQGLAAGIPQLIMPLAHDQPDNAARLRRFGVGDWLLPARFRGPALAERLQRLLTSPEVRAACQAYAARFVGRDGPAEASDAIERFAATRLAGPTSPVPAGGAGREPSRTGT